MRRLAMSLVLVACACARKPPDATPEGALRLWMDAMEASANDPRRVREAYDLLGPTARANLSERATRASRAQGRRVEGWDMLAQGHFGLRFRPETLRAHVVGETATVDVTGDEPSTEHATVRCVREGASWKVEPDLAPLPAVQRRPGSETTERSRD